MNWPTSAMAIANALDGIQVELGEHVGFSEARHLAREVVKRGLYGELRAGVEDVTTGLSAEQRLAVQARVGRVWCEVALGLTSAPRIRGWMEQQGYTPAEIAWSRPDP